MGRWTQYDEDDYRLPQGVKRIGYDADTGRYYFRDLGGSTWQGGSGEMFGKMTQVSNSKVPAVVLGDATEGVDDEDHQEPKRRDDGETRGLGRRILEWCAFRKASTPSRNEQRSAFGAPWNVPAGTTALENGSPSPSHKRGRTDAGQSLHPRSPPPSAYSKFARSTLRSASDSNTNTISASPADPANRMLAPSLSIRAAVRSQHSLKSKESHHQRRATS